MSFGPTHAETDNETNFRQLTNRNKQNADLFLIFKVGSFVNCRLHAPPEIATVVYEIAGRSTGILRSKISYGLWFLRSYIGVNKPSPCNNSPTKASSERLLRNTSLSGFFERKCSFHFTPEKLTCVLGSVFRKCTQQVVLREIHTA